MRSTTRLTTMATPLTTAYKSWIDESDCGLDEFRAVGGDGEPTFCQPHDIIAEPFPPTFT